MTILITGATGFLGTHLFNYLKDCHTVYGISEVSTNQNIISANLLNIDTCINELSKINVTAIDTIIHLASILASQNNLNDVSVLNQNNVLSQNVVLLAQKLNAKKIINFSSSSVYPNIDGEFNEASEINPALNPDAIYGLSKFNSEIIINTLIKNTTTTVSHLRCVMVYGNGVNPTRIWPVMEKELNEKNTITVFGHGKRLINQIEINTLKNVVNKFIVNNFPGIYNICEETLSLENLAKRIIAHRGNSESKIVYVEKGNTFQFKICTNKFNIIK